MRLESNDEPAAWKRATSCRQRSGDLSGMVSVVVDHGHSGHVAQPLEPTLGASELGEASRHRRQVGTQHEPTSNGRQSVEHVVAARYTQLDSAQMFVVVN